jgi:hypothetical protein
MVKICQFKLEMNMEGGGERVMRALYKTLKAKVYTFVKEIKGEEIEEISTEAERRLAQIIKKL